MLEKKKKEIQPKTEEKKKKDIQPRMEEKQKTEQEPKTDEKAKVIDEAIKRQQERFKEKEEKKPEGDPTIINTSIYDKIKAEISETPFVGGSGMWKTVTTAYNSCTDEFGKLTTTVDKLQEKVCSAQKQYFEKHFGKWVSGDLKGRGMTIGDIRRHRRHKGRSASEFPMRADNQ